jgi:hypothetical protein
MLRTPSRQPEPPYKTMTNHRLDYQKWYFSDQSNQKTVCLTYHLPPGLVSSGRASRRPGLIEILVFGLYLIDTKGLWEPGLIGSENPEEDLNGNDRPANAGYPIWSQHC